MAVAAPPLSFALLLLVDTQKKRRKKMYKTAAALSLLASASAFAPQSGSRVRLLLGQKKRWWIKSFRECRWKVRIASLEEGPKPGLG